MGMNLGSMAASQGVNRSIGTRLKNGYSAMGANPQMAANVSLVSNMVGDFGSNLINSTMSENNLKYGASKTNQIESAAGNVISLLNPALGAAYGVVNSGINVLESLVGTGNKYDEFGYNHAKGFQRGLDSYVKGMNPISGIARSIGEGGEGSGVRALLSIIPGLGSALQSKYEQERATERRLTANKIEQSGYEQNKFSYKPNFET